jgi:hypothetical protein
MLRFELDGGVRRDVPIKKRREKRAEEVNAAHDRVTREPVLGGEYLCYHHQWGVCVVGYARIWWGRGEGGSRGRGGWGCVW